MSDEDDWNRRIIEGSEAATVRSAGRSKGRPWSSVTRGSRRATVITGEERDRLFARGVERVPRFGVYQEQTTRVIPVVALERSS